MKRLFRTETPGLTGYVWLAAFAAAYLLLAGLVLAPQSMISLTHSQTETRHD